jgi:hypothetical protein
VRNYRWAFLALAIPITSGCDSTSAQRGTVSIKRDDSAGGASAKPAGGTATAPPAGEAVERRGNEF